MQARILDTTESGGDAENKTGLTPIAHERFTKRTDGFYIWIRASKTGLKLYIGLGKRAPTIRMPSAAQISAFNTTLAVLMVGYVIVFKDWPTLLMMIATIILIGRRGKNTL